MDSPKSSPVTERSNADSVPEKSSPKASPSLSQGLIDITKQFLNWPKFGIDFNSAEEEDSSKKEETEQETESPEYTLAKAQWTPKWPENFDDSEISQDTDRSAQNENSSKKEETEKETESPEYTLAKAQWTPKWPENFDGLDIAQDTDQSVQNDTDLSIQSDTDPSVQTDTDPSVQNDTDPSAKNDADPSIQNDTDQSDQSATDPNVQSDADSNAQKYAHQKDMDQNDQNYTDHKDQEDMDQNDSERSSKVSFGTTDYSETTDEMDQDIENESSEGEQPEFTVYREDDVPTLILQIPSWTEADDDDDPEEFDNLLYEIPSCTDSKTNLEEDISDGKKWFVEPGNNRNYIKALINYDLNNCWPRPVKSKGVFERVEQPRKFKWVINYDNMNYIRSLLRPEIFESIIERDLLKNKETYTLHHYREMLVD